MRKEYMNKYNQTAIYEKQREILRWHEHIHPDAFSITNERFNVYNRVRHKHSIHSYNLALSQTQTTWRLLDAIVNVGIVDRDELFCDCFNDFLCYHAAHIRRHWMELTCTVATPGEKLKICTNNYMYTERKQVLDFFMYPLQLSYRFSYVCRHTYISRIWSSCNSWLRPHSCICFEMQN